MRRDPATYLWDAERAAGYVLDLADGRSFADLQSDRMFRWALERQLQNIGESLSQLSRVAPDLASSVPDLAAIVAFRNILVHRYTQLDYELVWTAVHEKIIDGETHVRLCN